MKRIQCPCGIQLNLPEGGEGVKFRCPACGSVLRIRSKAKVPRDGPAPHAHAAAPGNENAEYCLTPDAEPASAASAVSQQRQPRVGFIPAPARGVAARRRSQSQTTLATAGGAKSDESLDVEEFPGPFLDRAALLYPWLYPTWVCWLGLSFMTALTIAAIGLSAFFFTIIMSFGAFVSLFTFAGMVTVCLGLSAYVTTTFVMVFEQTANGDNRLRRLPGYVWYEILPPFLRTVGAMGSAAGIAAGVIYLVRDQLGPWESEDFVINPMVLVEMMIISDVLVFLLFPVFMISNSVEQSFLPIWALFPTLVRLARRGGYLALFLVFSAVAWVAIHVVLGAMFFVHIALGLVAVGPLLAMYLLYYGHWLGRLTRQLMALD